MDIQANHDAIKETDINRTETELKTESMIVEKGGKFECVQADEMTINETRKTFPHREAASDKLSVPVIKARPKSAPTRSLRRTMPKRPMSAAVSDSTRRKVSVIIFNNAHRFLRRRNSSEIRFPSLNYFLTLRNYVFILIFTFFL